MRRQIRPQVGQKISLSQLANSVMAPYNHRSIPNYANHIFWTEENDNKNRKQETESKVVGKSKARHKIFDVFPSMKQLKVEASCLKISREDCSKLNNTNTSKESIKKQSFQGKKDTNIQQQIQQINRQLHLHRQTVQNQKLLSRDKSPVKTQAELNYVRIQQRLTESQQMLKKQSEFLSSKFPIFEQKLEQTKSAVDQIGKSLKQKLQVQNQIMIKLAQNGHKNSITLKTKQKQLERFMCSVDDTRPNQSAKDTLEIKRQQLEIQRIRRIEQLQRNNQQMLSKLQRGNSDANKYKFQDYIINKADQTDTAEIWSDEQPKFQNQKISKIYNCIPTKDNYSSAYSPNNTLAELLSPLALNDSKFML